MHEYKITFLSAGLPFNGNSLRTGSLGGSETGIICLAREFAAKGHDVTVFSPCGAAGQGVFDGVTYFDYGQWQELGIFLTLDILIINRASKHLTDNCRAKAIYFYAQDMFHQNDPVHERLWQTDRVAVLSPFHRKVWEDAEPNYAEHIFNVKNGVDLALIAKARKSVQKNTAVRDDKINFIYASCPERGLRVLLDMWPRILKEVPNAFLNVVSYDTSAIPKYEASRQIADQCRHLISQYPDSISINTRGLKKFELYRLYDGCKALLYPCGFPEISCITALEAMATQTLVITTNAYAFPDTVGSESGVLIDGHPVEAQYQTDFIAAVVAHANSLQYAGKVRSALKKVTEEYDWSEVSKLWMKEFDQFFDERHKNNKTQIINNLVYHEDLSAASYLARNYGDVDFYQACEHKALMVRRNPARDRQPHIYPGSTPEGMTLRNILSVYLSKNPEASHVKIEGSGNGDMAAFICKTFSQLHITGVDHESQNADARDYYLLSPDSPLDASVRSRLSFITSAAPDNSYDIVIGARFLDYAEDLGASVQDLEFQAASGALIVSLTREGAWSYDRTLEQPGYLSGKRYNFEGQDLHELLSHKRDFQAVCVAAGRNKRDEVLSVWLTSWIKTTDSSIGSIDYHRKMLTYRPYQKLSLCMITRNEEDNISKCLKSVRDIVDEVIITDTGSTDSTLDIARKLIPKDRLKIETMKWPEDFSKARNHSLESCTGDWILWLDADEFLTKPHFLSKYLNSTILKGMAIRQHHVAIDTEMKPNKPVRLFKRGPIKWYGVVHEQVETGMDESVKPTLTIQDMHIVHTGYTHEDIRRDKSFTRNIALLRKDRLQNPDRRLGKFLLAREYRNLINYALEDSLKNHQGVTSEVKVMMREVCAIHLEDFTSRNDPLYIESNSIYQEVLRMMVRLGIPVRDNIIGTGIKTVPFVFPSPDDDTKSVVRRVHFLTETEYTDYCVNYMNEVSELT